ncbi:hypothetical protein SAMN05443245_1875 [Paraburkholderia fungorum]|uniref:Uncharacterized protein n=1 Tax=Paraburkholderia fungorum TaxID=134537 RepID=A0A1H1BY54_9BURK|nr:hypothetical protein SAMN05443245_1875 [Paraburkholderia fungorum]
MINSFYSARFDTENERIGSLWTVANLISQTILPPTIQRSAI